MGWRLANSLVTLRNQVNRAYPYRSKASDGTIGDAAHAGTVSDHNPNSAGVVTAFDITHDPANGLDIAQLSQTLADTRDNRIKYIIRNRQILIPPNWGWQIYSGSDPHTNHLHISVTSYDDAREWQLTEKEKDGMSTLDRPLATSLARAYCGPGADENLISQMIGMESNTAVYWIEAHPSHADYLKYLAGVAKEAQDGSGEFEKFDIPTLYVKK